MAKEWTKVDELMKQGKIVARYMDYLFIPNEIIISKDQGDSFAQLQAYIAQTWLISEQPWFKRTRSIDANPKDIDGEYQRFRGSINAGNWRFDGRFGRNTAKLVIDHLPSETEEFKIIDLSWYPARFASTAAVEALRKRETGKIPNSTEPRFMVDIATYQGMHPKTEPFDVRSAPTPDYLDPQYMAQDNPGLGDEFFMCLPTTIPGFNMDKKEWVMLDVHYLEDVEWNKEAYDFLVIDEETKLLIRAVVTNQIRASKNADIIPRKGNGLFILLHGGPGTGKTLTAESVAEIAGKPLFKVTCAGIGTKAEEVEQYLSLVSHLGKTWGCVVLLDEADIFLEERSLINIERNALVSVFLQVLEYYEGILILTSNRVGIFDEAFKSRIQLNLRYKNLDWDQRLQIWKNFISHLKQLEKKRLETEGQDIEDNESKEYGINTTEIEAEIESLADSNLNGRQIRDAISTARQLAEFQCEPMTFHHLKTVISETQKFDEYLLDVQKGFTADEIQRDKRAR